MFNPEKIKKNLIHLGKADSNLENGCKVWFHMKVETTENESVLDDSHKWGEPMELLIGKKFKLEVLEACVQTMKENEVSSFVIDKKLVRSYPTVAQTMRNFHKKRKGVNVEERPRQCCGMGMKDGLGYKDLDELLNNPQDLKFTIDLVKVERVGSYEKDYWAMTEEEQMASINKLKSDGNCLYKECSYKEASKLYAEAIGRVESFMLKEKPRDEEWNVLNRQKLPILLNFCQCKLLLGEYYQVIEHCTTVLDFEPENVKALFRRGKAHHAVHNLAEATQDIRKAASVDPSISKICNGLLNEIENSKKEGDKSDKESFKMMFSKSEAV